MARYNRDIPFDKPDPVENYASLSKHLERLEHIQDLPIDPLVGLQKKGRSSISIAEPSSDDVNVVEPTCTQKKHEPSIDTIEPSSDPENLFIVGPSRHPCSEDEDISLLECPPKCQHVDNDVVGDNRQLQKLLEEVREIKEIYKETIKVQMEQTAAQLKVAEQLAEALAK
ncbi:hypothetical protein K439DRAFT_1618306 [Ramaria rubella]|nr:hypothetical protein K439DRAFT_1618306 [Ramaria rubella]